MKKNSLKNYEIDIFELLKTIWDKKIAIIIILSISLLICIGDYYYKKANHKKLNIYSIKIKPTQDYEIMDLQYLSSYLGSTNTKISILKRFIAEIMDYEEFLNVYKNYVKTNDDNVKFANTLNQNFFPLSEMFNITISGFDDFLTSSNNKDLFEPTLLSYQLNFKWDNDSEAVQIINQTLDQSLNNLSNAIFKELEQLTILEINKKKLEDGQKLQFLKEQSLIARELNIENSRINNIDLSQSSVLLALNANDFSYYLKGYPAIEKEINLIENRKYEDLIYVENQIKRLKNKDLMLVRLNPVEKESILSSMNLRKNLIIAILIGLVVSFFYIIILLSLKSNRVQKKP